MIIVKMTINNQDDDRMRQLIKKKQVSHIGLPASF